jgi:REP element-mobilizing transposase RayT
MPRPPRLQYEGAIYHVTTRGNGRRTTYFDDIDYEMFFRELGVTVTGLNWLCHSFVAMPNHYHAVIETPEANLSEGMHRINGLYARRFNRRHGQADHLFGRRFHAVEIKSDEQMLQACRYDVLNPVRADICAKAENWSWSSFRATAGIAARPYFLTLDRTLGYFSANPARAMQLYNDFVHEAGAPQSLADLEARLKLIGDSVVPKAA